MFLSPGRDFQDRIRSVSNAELPEGLKVTEMSPDPLNLSMILCSVDDGIFKV